MKKLPITAVVLLLAAMFSISTATWYGTVKRGETEQKGADVQAIDCWGQDGTPVGTGSGGGYYLNESNGNMEVGHHYSFITATWDDPESENTYTGYIVSPDTFWATPHVTGLDITISYPGSDYSCD